MRTIWMAVLAAFLLGCAPASLSPDLPMQVVGPENHALILDGLS
ncbi:MAG: hypothetical protein ACM3Q1_18070 [Bacteroidales bacterium]